MKRVLLLAITCFISLSVYSQEIDTKQRTLVMKKASDGCSVCGGWGWDLFHRLVHEISDDEAIIWVFHHSGGLKNDVATAMSQNFSNVGGQPRFFVNNDDINANSNVNQFFDEVELTVEGLNLFPADIGIGSEAILTNGVLSVNNNIELFTETSNGDLYVASYLIEKERIAYQSGQGNNAGHLNYLRAAIGGENFGTLVANNGMIGETYSDLLEMDVEADFDVNDYQVATVVWFNSSGTYNFFNGKVVDIEENINSSSSELFVDDISVTTNNNVLDIEWDETLKNIERVEILSANAEILFQDGVSQNVNSMTIDISNWTAGTYIVRLNTLNESFSKQLIIVK